ncbi:MAG: hypothetical protein AB7N91_30275 [Candidatus Tectimicrobiota bacterium]
MALIVRVVACLAEGLGIRATARVFEGAPNTVLQWLSEAAEQLRAFSAYFLCDLHLEQVQLDELYAVLRALKAGEITNNEAIRRLERSPSWVWTAMDPTSTLRVVVEVGSRTLALAQRVVHQVTHMLAPGCVPLLLTDGLKEYGTALLTHFGYSGFGSATEVMLGTQFRVTVGQKTSRKQGVANSYGHQRGLPNLWITPVQEKWSYPPRKAKSSV